MADVGAVAWMGGGERHHDGGAANPQQRALPVSLPRGHRASHPHNRLGKDPIRETRPMPVLLLTDCFSACPLSAGDSKPDQLLTTRCRTPHRHSLHFGRAQNDELQPLTREHPKVRPGITEDLYPFLLSSLLGEDFGARGRTRTRPGTRAARGHYYIAVRICALEERPARLIRLPVRQDIGPYTLKAARSPESVPRRISASHRSTRFSR